jgi:hypothetical protein
VGERGEGGCGATGRGAGGPQGLPPAGVPPSGHGAEALAWAPTPRGSSPPRRRAAPAPSLPDRPLPSGPVTGVCPARGARTEGNSRWIRCVARRLATGSDGQLPPACRSRGRPAARRTGRRAVTGRRFAPHRAGWAVYGTRRDLQPVVGSLGPPAGDRSGPTATAFALPGEPCRPCARALGPPTGATPARHRRAHPASCGCADVADPWCRCAP